MRHTLFSMMLGLLLMTGLNVNAQAPTTPDETTTLSAITVKASKKEKKNKTYIRGTDGKRLTRYEVTDLEQQEEFLAAVQTGNLDEAKDKYKSQYFYAFDDGGENPLTRAIKNRDVDMLRFLTEEAVINLANEEGETPLILAIETGNREIIDMIIERANPSLHDAAGVSPLMAALESEDLDLLLELILKGADLNKKSQGITPIFKAVEKDNTEAVAMLAHHGADPSIPNEDGDIPLYNAVRNGNNIIAGILLHKSEQVEKDANWKTQKGDPILNVSIKGDQDQITRMLLDFGASTYQTDYLENTPLNLAAKQGDAVLVKILLEKGANPNHRNITGETPILTATREGYSSVTDLLAQAGADITTEDYNGFAANDRRRFGELTDPEIVDAVMEMTNDDRD